MPGKLCTGTTRANSYLPKASKAFSEGIYYRAAGTGAGQPVSDNPHDTGTTEGSSWLLGWLVADSAAGTTIAQSDAPCVAVPTNTILV